MMRIEIERGLNIPLGPVANSAIELMPSHVALLGQDFPGLRPNLLVEKGQRVHTGDVLFTDRSHPDICFTAPASGVVASIHRGRRRSLEAVVISFEEARQAGSNISKLKLMNLSPDNIRYVLQRTGLWTLLRSRPYNHIPLPDAVPKQLFITAMDTNPLAPDASALIHENAQAFEQGLTLLARLSKKTFVCQHPGVNLPCPEVDGLTPIEFTGVHPAGLPGTHMYRIAMLHGLRSPPKAVWHIGYQAVIAIGKLFLSGTLDSSRTISVAGPGAGEPRLVKTFAGAGVDTLIADSDSKLARVISGPALSGHLVSSGTGHLGHYDNQLVLLAPAEDSNTSPGGMLAVEAFDAIWPFAVPPLPLLRALLVRDSDTVSAMGCSFLAEEDMGLCSYVCPAGHDYGEALRQTLNEIRKGASY